MINDQNMPNNPNNTEKVINYKTNIPIQQNYNNRMYNNINNHN